MRLERHGAILIRFLSSSLRLMYCRDAVADPSFPYNCDGDLHFRIKLTFYSKSESRAGYSPQRDSADDDMSKEKKTNIVKRRSKLH